MVPQRLEMVSFCLKRWTTRLSSEKGDMRYLTKRVEELIGRIAMIIFWICSKVKLI